jgi:hypothetical protein
MKLPQCPVCERRSGFTLVEAVIVAVVIAVILAASIPWMREQHEERERQRLQGLADSEPWEVFEFRASQVLDPAAVHGLFISIRCEIANPTKYPLTLPQNSVGFALTLGDTEYVVSSQVPHSPALLNPPIEPGALLSFDSSFFPYFAGTTELRAVFLGKDNPESFDLGFPTGEAEEDRRYEQLAFTYGLLPHDEKRFESERFLAITEVDVGVIIPTGEEFIIRAELRR